MDEPAKSTQCMGTHVPYHMYVCICMSETLVWIDNIVMNFMYEFIASL